MVTQAKAKKTLRGQPLRAYIVGSWGLMVKSDFIDGCLLFLEVQIPTLADFFYNHSFDWPQGARIHRPFWTASIPGPMGIKTNITHSGIFIIEILSTYELILLARIRLSIVIPTL